MFGTPVYFINIDNSLLEQKYIVYLFRQLTKTIKDAILSKL